MGLELIVGIASVTLAAAGLLFACFAWRNPRTPAPNPSADDQAEDDGLALALLFVLAVRERKKARVEKR